MSIDDIQIDELRKFAKNAQSNGCNVTFDGDGILKITDHKFIPDASIFWDKAHSAYRIKNNEEEISDTIPVGKLNYPGSIPL